jgi:hypothetical protein
LFEGCESTPFVLLPKLQESPLGLKICDFFGKTVMAPTALKFNFRGPHTFLKLISNYMHSPQIAIYFIVIYKEIEERKVWGPRGKTYL